MAYAGLLDGGLTVMVGCAADWTGGTNITSLAHGLEFETSAGGIGGASFWVEVTDPFNVGYSWLMHGKRVNISHTYDAVTSYLYKGFIVNDPRRALAGETARVTVELGGPTAVAKYRRDCGFSFTDADTQTCWIVNKRNNKVFNCETGDSIRIAVDKGDKVPDDHRGGVIGYVPYLGAQYMIGTNAQNKFNGVKRLDGHITTKLGDGMKARLMGRASGYTDERDVTSSAWTLIKEWTSSLTNQYFDSNSWGHSWPTDGYKYVALVLFSEPATGASNVMSADRSVEFDDVRVYTGTIAKRIDEGMLTIANWLNLHTTSTTDPLYSVIPSLVARPYTDPITAMNDFSLQCDKLVQWGYFVSRSTNNIQFRAKLLPTSGIRAGTSCYTISTTVPGVVWDVRPHPEDGMGDIRAIRFVYGRVGRKSDWPAGTPAAVIGTSVDGGPNDPGFRNTGGPFQGASSIVPTVDFSGKNFTDEHAKQIAKRLGRSLMTGDKMGGSASAKDQTLVRTVDSAVVPWAYLQGGEFVVCTQEGATSKPLLINRCHVDVDGQAVELELGLPQDALVRQLESAGALKAPSAKAFRRRRR